jgi:hypothetical protein
VRWNVTSHSVIPSSTGLAEIPGVRVRSRLISVPDNALPIVREILRAANVGFTASVPPATALRDPFPKSAKLAVTSGALREWVPGFLTPYQRDGILWSLRDAPDGSGHLWWPTGAGKTLGAIVWGCADRRRVVIVTKGAVKLQWRSEVERFTTLVPEVLEGEKSQPISLHAPWIVLNYEILPAWIDEIERWARGLQLRPSMILDESHKVKSYKRWEAIVPASAGGKAEDLADAKPLDVSDLYGAGGPLPTGPRERIKFNLNDNVAAAVYRLSRLAGRRLATTRTPIKDRPRDLWAQLDLIHPDEWGPYFGPRGENVGYAWRYCGAAEGAFGGIDDRGKSNLDELKARLSVVANIIPDAVVSRDLPPKRRQVTTVPIGEQVRAVGMARDLKGAARLGGTGMLELRLMEAAARKRRRVLELVEAAVASREKVVVFTGRRRDCDELMEAIRRICPNVYGGHGGHSATERDAAKNAYMSSAGPAVLVGTTDAWGEGLNLQDTDLLIVTMLPYTPGQIIQLEGRVARLGQKRPVLIVYLVAEGTIDEHVVGILLGKLPAVEKAIGLDEVAGFGRELSGADDASLVKSLVAKITGGLT